MGRHLTAEQLNALRALYDYRCAICRQETGDSFVVDHDHSCCPEAAQSYGKCIRGILCHKCNRCLGAFDDDRDRIAWALDYLNSQGAGLVSIMRLEAGEACQRATAVNVQTQ